MISAFTVTWNVFSLGYPFLESILQALPYVDEFVVLDGYSTDGTLQLLEALESIHEKVKLHTVDWNPTEEGYESIARVSNLALKHTRNTWSWLIQADEFYLKEDMFQITRLPLRFPNEPGFLFNFLHFKNQGPLIPLRVAYRIACRFFRKDKFRITHDGWSVEERVRKKCVLPYYLILTPIKVFHFNNFFCGK